MFDVLFCTNVIYHDSCVWWFLHAYMRIRIIVSMMRTTIVIAIAIAPMTVIMASVRTTRWCSCSSSVDYGEYDIHTMYDEYGCGLLHITSVMTVMVSLSTMSSMFLVIIMLVVCSCGSYCAYVSYDVPEPRGTRDYHDYTDEYGNYHFTRYA